MFSYSRPRLLCVGLALLVAACGPEPRGAGAQDLGDQLFAPRDQFVERPQLQRRPARSISGEDPARILVIGDSLAQGFGIFLDRRVKQRELNAEVTNRGRTSTGLARSDFYNWPRAFAEQAAALKPDVVVVHFGANDNQGIILPDRRVGQGSESWEEVYREQTRRILEIAAAHDTMLYWIGPAPDRSSSLNRHLTRINPIFEDEAKQVGAVYLPLNDFAAGEGGEYVRNVSLGGRSVTIRSGDGSHFTGAGYFLVADKILEDMQRRVPDIFSGPRVELAGILQ